VSGIHGVYDVGGVSEGATAGAQSFSWPEIALMGEARRRGQNLDESPWSRTGL
jgi:hypothetical protein